MSTHPVKLKKLYSEHPYTCHIPPTSYVDHQYFLTLTFSSIQSLSRARLFATPSIAARPASLSITNSQSLLKLMSIESVMPSSHLILCRPLLLLPPIPPSIRVFSNESSLHMRWPEYWSFSVSIHPLIHLLKKNVFQGFLWWSSGQDSALSIQGPWARSLVRELDPTCCS